MKVLPVGNIRNLKSENVQKYLKTAVLCEEDETPSFIDKVILVAYGVVITWVALLMLMV